MLNNTLYTINKKDKIKPFDPTKLYRNKETGARSRLNPHVISKHWSDEKLLNYGIYREVDERVEPTSEFDYIDDEEVVYDSDNDKVVRRNIIKTQKIVSSDINKERDRRIHAGFLYKDKIIQSDPNSVARIINAVSMAKDAIEDKEDITFEWITEDNTELTLTPQEVCEMYKAYCKHETTLIKKARQIKKEKDLTKYKEDATWQ